MSYADILSQEKKTRTDEKKTLQDVTKKMEEQYHQLVGKAADKEDITFLYEATGIKRKIDQNQETLAKITSALHEIEKKTKNC